jgi:hypothetical protein
MGTDTILDFGFWIGEASRSKGFSLRTVALSVSIGMKTKPEMEAGNRKLGIHLFLTLS